MTLATYVVFAASRANELNYETYDDAGQGVGLLTYAVSKVFENLDPGSTYRSIFAKVHSAMHAAVPFQNPVLEGNGIDRMLFGGKFVHQKPYAEIKELDGRSLVIKSGKLSGLDVGATVAVYKSGTIDPAKATALAKGTVAKAECYTAIVQLDNDPGLMQPASGWVFITNPVYSIRPVTVGLVTDELAESFSASEIYSIKNALKDLPLITFEGEPELLIKKGKLKDSILIASNGHLFSTARTVNADQNELKEIVQRYLQYKFLQVLEIKDLNNTVEIKLVPMIDGQPDLAQIDTKSINGNYSFTEGDQFMLLVKNTGNKPVYINILDIQPNGVINPVLPFKQKYLYPSDLKIEKGTSRLFNRVCTIGPPYGIEILKIFVSTQEIDMEGIATTQGGGTRGSFTVLEELVKMSYQAATRGSQETSASNADGSMFNLFFEITPKK